MKSKIRRKIVIAVLVFVVAFFCYSWFFRTYLEPMQYLEMAWQNVEYDPYISNWNDPEFELAWKGLRPEVRFVFYLDKTSYRKEINVSIDPLTKNILVDGQEPAN